MRTCVNVQTITAPQWRVCPVPQNPSGGMTGHKSPTRTSSSGVHNRTVSGLPQFCSLASSPHSATMARCAVAHTTYNLDELVVALERISNVDKNRFPAHFPFRTEGSTPNIHLVVSAPNTNSNWLGSNVLGRERVYKERSMDACRNPFVLV